MSAQTWATVDDMAARLQVSVRTVRARVNSDGKDRWPSSRVGNRIRFSPEQQDTIERMLSPKRTPARRASRVQAAFEQMRTPA